MPKNYFLLSVAVSLLCFCSPSTFATSQDELTLAQDRSTWNFSLRPSYMKFDADENDQMHGTNISIDIGYGRLKKQWVSQVAISFIAGPFEPTTDSERKVDFTGTGLNIHTAYLFRTLGSTYDSPRLGLQLGLLYRNVIGRSVSTSEPYVETVFDSLEDDASSTIAINDYVWQVNDISLGMGIVFCRLKIPRPVGTTPELQLTRVEGLIGSVNISQPLTGYYRTSFRRSVNDGPEETFSHKGTSKGFTVYLQILAMLGA
jgi:hypothetical protein